MSFPPQSIPLTGAIGTTAPEDVFPTHYDSLGSGGMRAVATLVARDAIPVERRVFGMFVFVVEANSLYVLRNVELGGQSDDLSDNGNWKVFAPGGGGATTINHETESLAAGSIEDFTIAAGDVFHLLSLTASTPAWVRVYGTSAARAADTRTSPGGTPPLAGSEFYAELVTTAAPQTIRFSPVPLVQGTAGDAFVRVKNMDTVSRTISLDFSVITLAQYTGDVARSFVIWFDNESARIHPPGVTSIISSESEGSYETTEHLGQLAFAPPPGVLGESAFYHSWEVNMPDAYVSGDFTVEAWARSSTSSPPFGGFGEVEIAQLWTAQDPLDSMSLMLAKVGLTDVEDPGTLSLEHEIFASVQTTRAEGEFPIVFQFDYELFGGTVQGWKHLCYQRIGGEDVFHYHGSRFILTQGDELPTPRPILPGARVTVRAENQATSGVALGQTRVSIGALYGTGNFTPPSTAFYTP